MKTKVTINIERGSLYDFQLTDEVTVWGVPFVVFLHSNLVELISPLTNKIVKTIDFGPSLLAQHPKLLKKVAGKNTKTFNVFDNMCLSHYLEIYLSSSKLDCMFFLKLDDPNVNDTEIMYKVVGLKDQI